MDASLYCRPNKPKTLLVQHRGRDREPVKAPAPLPEIVAVDRSTECHVTPGDVAKRMAEYLEILPGMDVLEPEGGTGSLIAPVLNDRDFNGQVTTVERHCTLADALRTRFDNQPVDVHQGCFIEFAIHNRVAGRNWSRIIMNPPFRHVKEHFRAALTILGRGGILVALVPVTYVHPSAVELERLDSDTFPTAKVNTKIIQITL